MFFTACYRLTNSKSWKTNTISSLKTCTKPLTTYLKKISRKRNTKNANEGELGIIPGSQGTKSYIIKGLGNAESFKSCSHGAGRVMGRKQAIIELDLVAEQELMKGIVHNIDSEEQLDEAPSAYKDIDVVMENQKDLAEIYVELKPMAVIKG